jgi:NTP pyrophosphatase (non-canonical NTP hydrolase)
VGELGELVNSIVKYYRKSDLITLKIQDLPPALRKKLKDESYDALHFLMFLLNEQGISLAELIAYGREKLEKRMEEGTVHKENRIDGSLVGRTVNITATVTDKSPITTATRTETFQSVILCEDLYSIKYSLEGPNLVTIVDFISFEVVDKLPGDWHEKIKSLPSTKSGSVLRQTFYSKMI